jgi:predicted permease
VLANRMGGDGQIIAAQVSLTTLLSMATLPAWLWVARNLAGGG